MTTPPSRNPAPKPVPRPEEAPERGLIRELWALLLIYGTLVVLPLLTGIACES